MGQETLGGGSETPKQEDSPKLPRLTEESEKSEQKGIRIDAAEKMATNEEIEKAETILQELHKNIIAWWKENQASSPEEINTMVTEIMDSGLTLEEKTALAESGKYARGATIYDEASETGSAGVVFGWEWKGGTIEGWSTYG